MAVGDTRIEKESHDDVDGNPVDYWCVYQHFDRGEELIARYAAKTDAAAYEAAVKGGR